MFPSHDPVACSVIVPSRPVVKLPVSFPKEVSPLTSNLTEGFVVLIPKLPVELILALSRYSLTLGGWSELTAFSTTNGLVIGTQDGAPIVFGTNNAERARISSDQPPSVKLYLETTLVV